MTTSGQHSLVVQSRITGLIGRTSNVWILEALLVGVLLLIYTGEANAQQLLDYGTFSGYGLGKGIRGNDYKNPLAACITGAPSSLPASHSDVRVSIVYNADEYKEAFHIDQKAEASYLGYGGSDELHIGKETGRSGSAYDIIVEAYGEHDSDTINNIKWDPQWDAMIRSGNAAQIQQVRLSCGDRYIQTVFKETRLFAVLHVSSQQYSSLTQLSLQTAGKVGISVLSASASLGGDLNIATAHKAGAISIDIYSEGLGGVVPTAAAVAIAPDGGLQDVATKLAAYLASLHESGQPVKYLLSPLPNLPTGDLSDQQIFAYLEDFKSKYLMTYDRLGNVKLLLNPSDPRRILFKQPQADTALNQQEGILTAYLNTVSQAHDRCRQAASLNDCTVVANMVGAVPARLSVELAPIGPTLAPTPPFVLAIDGNPLTPAQSASILSNYAQASLQPGMTVLLAGLNLPAGTTLMEAAKHINPNASNVDVIAPIDDPYLSYIEIFTPMPIGTPLYALSHPRLFGQDLSFPAYWKDYDRGKFAIHVLHADVQHPCSIVNSGGLNFVAENCLTMQGRLLRDAALLAVARIMTNPTPPTQFDAAFEGALANCFGPSFFANLSIFRFDIIPGASPNEVATRMGLFLPMGYVSFPLVVQEESHDKNTWNQLLQTRIAVIAPSGQGFPTGNACAPQVP